MAKQELQVSDSEEEEVQDTGAICERENCNRTSATKVVLGAFGAKHWSLRLLAMLQNCQKLQPGQVAERSCTMKTINQSPRHAASSLRNQAGHLAQPRACCGSKRKQTHEPCSAAGTLANTPQPSSCGTV